eukprot:TRINITY_DN1722_c0_g1_i10.p2 TRINITY_DN1722_c0_g1~~TRINITY_DN1722_c0_g1_i10.p2  ORF type:complete len:238 (-),score=80.69 TRINITY_DN1722_c0_g1_i10:132-845(-)
MSEEPEFPLDDLKDEDDSAENKFGKTAKLEGLFFGRETIGQGKKRIGQGGTKIPHHKRTRTELPPTKNQVLMGKPKYREFEDKVQIVEPLEDSNSEEAKGDLERPKLDEFTSKVDQQIRQSEELIAKVMEDQIEMNDFESDNERHSNILDENISVNDTVDESVREVDVTVGEILNDIAILITTELHLFAWPLDMLPQDVKKGEKFSLLIKWNPNSEVLRKNTIYTQQNEILKELQNQ